MSQHTPWPTMAVSVEDDPARRKTVGMLAFPRLTLLDLFGPHAVLTGIMQTHLVWKAKGPILSDTGVSVLPDMSFDEAPERFDILFVPGGPGQASLFNDPEVMAFLAHHGARADWVTSVCTGAMILGAAGLLDGYRAATHWAGRDVLRLFGADPVAERVVIDRNRITGGGVTAGVDFGLTLLKKIYGSEVAETTQLLMEYDPAPPINAGSVDKARPEISERAMEILAPVAQITLDALSERFS